MQDRHGHIPCPAKSHQDDEGTGASLLGEKAERLGTVQPEEKKAQKDLVNVHKYMKGRRKEDVARHRLKQGVGDSLRTSGDAYSL